MKLQNAGTPHFAARYHAQHTADAERIIEAKSHEGVDAIIAADLNGVSVITNEGELKHLDAYLFMSGEKSGDQNYYRREQAKHFFASYPDPAVDTYVRGFMQEAYLCDPDKPVTDRRKD